MHGGLSDSTIRRELDRRDSPEETARKLVELALQARTGDNATALVVDAIALPTADRFELEAAVNALPIIPAPKSGAVIDGYTPAKCCPTDAPSS